MVRSGSEGSLPTQTGRASKLDRPFDARGIAILEMGGKGNLHVPVSILWGLGIPVFVVVDGDAMSGKRKHPHDPIKASKIDGTHLSEMSSLLAWLPSTIAPENRSLPYMFGAPSLVTKNYAILEDNLESVLGEWPSFVGELAAGGRELRDSKDVAAYRSAAMGADVGDLPSVFADMVDAIHAFLP